MRIERENAAFQLLEALRHNRRKREQRGEFLVEGVQAIDRCVAAGWPVRAVLAPSAASRRGGRRASVDALAAAERLELAPDLFARLADREEPPELLLVARIPAPDLSHVPRSGRRRRRAGRPAVEPRATSARSSARPTPSAPPAW